MSGSALILGSAGRFGRQAADAFEAAGWTVVRFHRGRDDLATLARQADVVVNGWNLPYTEWAGTVPGLTADVIAAVQGTDATVILPGNVYVFGQDAPAPWGPGTPHRAQNPLGRVRCVMEQAYRDAGVRTIVLRAGDFLDTAASGNWFDRIMAKSLDKGVLTYPGDPDARHAWGFLPDMAKAAVMLAEKRSTLSVFCDVPFPGYTLTGREICHTLGNVMGKPVRLKQMSWTPIRLISPFWPMGRSLLEMRYLWNTPHWLDATAFDALLPGFAHTPVEQAFGMAVQGAGFGTRSTQTNRWRLADKAVL